jgi:hypothetical protein
LNINLKHQWKSFNQKLKLHLFSGFTVVPFNKKDVKIFSSKAFHLVGDILSGAGYLQEFPNPSTWMFLLQSVS